MSAASLNSVGLERVSEMDVVEILQKPNITAANTRHITFQILKPFNFRT